MPPPEIPAGRGADIQRHPNTLAFIIISTATNRPQKQCAWPEVSSLHLLIHLEPAACQHHRPSVHHHGLIARTDSANAADAAILTQNQIARGGIV